MTKEEMGKEIAHLKRQIKILKQENELLHQIASNAIKNEIECFNSHKKVENAIKESIINEAIFAVDIAKFRYGVKLSNDDAEMIKYLIEKIKNNKYV